MSYRTVIVYQLTVEQHAMAKGWGISPRRAEWLATCPRALYRKTKHEPFPGGYALNKISKQANR
jgi:hypothetical protein